MERPRQLVRLSEVEEIPIRWLWPDRIPLGAITLLDGDSSQGKSTLTYDLASRVTTGIPMPGCEAGAEPAGVVLLQAEDDPGSVMRPRLRAAGADIDRIIAYDRAAFQGQPLLLPDDLRLIESAAQQVSARLIVIDPITAFLGVHAQSDQAVRKALGLLTAVAERLEVAVLLVRHLNKGGSANPLYRGAGSIGMIASARSALMVGDDPGRDEPHHHILTPTKSNLSRAPSLSYRTVLQGDAIIIEWLGESRYTAAEVAGSGRIEQSALAEAMYVLYSLLTDAPLPAKEVIRLSAGAGVSKRTLERAKKALRVEGRKVGSGRGSYWMWRLPADAAFLRPFMDRDIEDLTARLLSETDLLDKPSPPYRRGPSDDPSEQGDQWSE